MAGAAGKGDLPAWYKEMEKDLECPVCLISFLDPPIYVCENQHGLCSTCRTKLNNQKKPCPVCNGKLTAMRCLMMEKLLDKLPGTKCKYPECSFKRADHQAALDHQEDCSHRKAPCAHCGQSVAMSSLTQHLTSKHGGKIHRMKNPDWVWDLHFNHSGQKVMQGPPNTTLGDVVFYLNSVLLNNNNSMWWVSYNGQKKDGNKYQFSIDVMNGKRLVLSGTKFCVPCDTSCDVVKEKYLGIIINKDLATQVKTGGDQNNPYFTANIQFFLAL